MTRPELAGWLLVGSFALWIPAAVLPSRIWTAPLPDRLALVARHREKWRLVNLSIAGAAVSLVLGFAALAALLEDAGAGAVVPLSLAVLVIGVALWLASLTFRITVTPVAAREALTGFEAASAWAGGLFLAWSVLGNAAIAGLGAAIVQSGYPAAWCGWVTIALAALMLIQLLVTGDALPALYHVGPLVVGVVLLLD